MGYQSASSAVIMAAFVVTFCIIIIGPPLAKGECTMCTGAEAAAAGSAKGTAGAAAGSGLTATAATGGLGAGLAATTSAGLTATAATGGLGAGLAATGVGTGFALTPAAAAAFGTGAATGAGLSSLLTAKNVTAGASAVNAGVGLLSAIKGAKTPAAPTLEKPLVMPSPDDETVKRARRSMLQTLSQRRGRSSTILSNDTLGGN